jgi:hypothetical protein
MCQSNLFSCFIAGAFGSTFVAFVLPCIFHLRLCWSALPLSIKTKDILVTIMGVGFCVTGVNSVFKDITVDV